MTRQDQACLEGRQEIKFRLRCFCVLAITASFFIHGEIAQAGSFKEASAKGTSQFWYGTKKLAKDIAREEAYKRLEGVCKRKNMILYRGEYRSKNRFSLLKVKGIRCRSKRGQYKCRVSVEGRCVPRNSGSFVFYCDRTHAVHGMATLLPHGVLKILTSSGEVVALNPETVRASIKGQGGNQKPIREPVEKVEKKRQPASPHNMLCSDGYSPSALQRLAGWVKGYVLERYRKCENDRKKHKESEECKEMMKHLDENSVSGGGVRG